MNAARPAAGAVVARSADALEGRALVLDFRAGDALFSLIVARGGGVVRAYENVCPHARFPLERLDGTVVVQEGAFLVCAAHGASFRIADGVCVAGPGGGALTAFAVREADGLILAA